MVTEGSSYRESTATKARKILKVRRSILEDSEREITLIIHIGK